MMVNMTDRIIATGYSRVSRDFECYPRSNAKGYMEPAQLESYRYHKSEKTPLDLVRGVIESVAGIVFLLAVEGRG